MVDFFHRVGHRAVLYDSCIMEYRTGESSIAQSLSTLAGMPSGPMALPILHLLSSCRTSTSVKGGVVGRSEGRALSSSLQMAE